MTKGVVYYTDGRLKHGIAKAVQQQLRRCVPTWPLVVTSCDSFLIDFAGEPPPTRHIVLAATRDYLTMFQQILVGLESLKTDVAFLCEHDVLYHQSHFDFTPERDDVYYYNQNVWKVDAATGRALHYRCSQTSGLCANRELLVAHYRKRVALVQAHGFTRAMGFEPGTHNRAEGVDDYGCETWVSAFPNIDIRHDTNLTESRWRKEQFRNQKYTEGWTEADAVPGWGVTAGRVPAFLADLASVGMTS